ncbi:DUF5050 domain-containing protein [Solibacillus sp. CAU 1738]|uniref:DUF5050 domain-containing protein n=1 Tax=Solibacillus sp. CAU 1738 TaxID=3140363 RepID=UPI003260C773
MFRKLVVLVFLLVFAKPIYETVVQYYEQNIDIIPVSMPAKQPIQQTGPPTTENKTKLQPSTVYDEQTLTEAFFNYFSHYQQQFVLHYKGDTADLANLLERAAMLATKQDSYIGGHLGNRSLEFTYTKKEATIHVTQEYLTNEAQEKVVEEKIADILADVPLKTMTDFEKVKFANDYIVRNTVYSEQAENVHSAYAVALEGKAVCQGYALFMTKLLREMGMEVLYVVGEVNTGGHAWNLVKVDGEWLHVDTTWNDPVPDRGQHVSYEYFLVNDARMKQDHTWIAADYPAANSKRFAYMQTMRDSYQYGDMIYYSHIDDGDRLYATDLKTGENKQLSRSRAFYITGIDEWLYFSNYSQGGFLTKIKRDGTAEQIIFREHVENLWIEDNFLYFTTESGLKKTEI